VEIPTALGEPVKATGPTEEISRVLPTSRSYKFWDVRITSQLKIDPE